MPNSEFEADVIDRLARVEENVKHILGHLEDAEEDVKTLQQKFYDVSGVGALLIVIVKAFLEWQL